MSTTPAVEAIELVKHFGDNVAVDGVSFVVPPGTVLGLLGPNGAGKTTLVRMLTTLSVPTSGTGRVAGHDILREPTQVRRSMGLTGQAATVDEILTGRENLKLIGALYGLPRKYVAEATERLFARFDLTDAADRMAKTYSGGMRRRLDLAVSLLAVPPILFLDEPTTGLDPHSRSGLWAVLRELVDEGTTLVLTTQYLEEADHLADEIVVVDRGKVIAAGTPTQLKDEAGRASPRSSSSMPLVSKTAAMRVMSPSPPACAVTRRLPRSTWTSGECARIRSAAASRSAALVSVTTTLALPARSLSCVGVPAAMTLPLSTTTISSARLSASSRYCVVRTSVVPSVTSSRSTSHRPDRLIGSRPVVGSSRNRIGGAASRLTARSIRRRMPPE